MRDSGSIVATCVLGLMLAAGCGAPDTDSGDDREPTWHGGVEALLVGSCGSCHTAGGLGPFPLDEYEAAKAVAAPALAAVEADIMPPWLAHDTDECAPPLPWKDDIRLSDDDKALLRAWVEAGSPLGDPATAVPVPDPPNLDLVDASATLPFAQPFAVEGDGPDVFECFVLDPGIDQDVWLTGVQFNGDNAKIDHHALVFLDPTRETEANLAEGHFPCFGGAGAGALVGAWAPGALPFEPPPTSGVPMPANSLLVVQMHYHPTGELEMDQSSVSIRYTTEQPEYDAALALLGNFGSYDAENDTGLMPGPNDSGDPEFVIPAGATDHVETMVYRHEVPLRVPIFAVGNHMHYVGTDMKLSHQPVAGGDSNCLLQTPRWDFEWQRAYVYDAPIDELPTIGPNDTLVMRCTYDNSLGNPAVADAVTEQGLTAPVDVRLGDETLDEMCLGVFGVLLPPGFL